VKIFIILLFFSYAQLFTAFTVIIRENSLF